MTDRAEIERLLNATGRTLEGLPERYAADKCLKAGRTKGLTPIEAGNSILHQSDVIELLVGALRDSLTERDAALAKVLKWISVKDRLPEKGDNVLISLCGCNVKQAVYRGDSVFEAAYADTYHSTDLGSIVLNHWMPTPKPMEVSE